MAVVYFKYVCKLVLLSLCIRVVDSPHCLVSSEYYTSKTQYGHWYNTLFIILPAFDNSAIY